MLPYDHDHFLGPVHLWGEGGRFILDFSEIDSGYVWFGQCVEGWLIYRRLDRGPQDDWEPARMNDPDASLYAECEHHCDGPSDARRWPSKAQMRAAKVPPHRDAINAEIERVAATRVPGVRGWDGRPAWACSETVADAKLAKIHDARGRKREQRVELSEHARRVRDGRDEPRSLPEPRSVDLWARGMAQGDPLLIERAARQAPNDPPSLRPPTWIRDGARTIPSPDARARLGRRLGAHAPRPVK